MRRAFLNLAVAIAILAPISGKAEKALSVDSLMGRWCGDISAYTFTPQQLTVTFFNGNPQRILRIKTINVSTNWIEVIWDPRDGVNTVFEEFTGNGMVQKANTGGDKGPRRIFHHC